MPNGVLLFSCRLKYFFVGGVGIIKNAVRHYRERAGLTQLRLSEAVKCSIDSVRRWESGQREPRASEIVRLCEVLGVSEAELLNGPAEETREFTLIYDREGDLRMEVLNMAANAPEQRVMSVSPQRIAAMVNIKTANLEREEAKKLMLDEMAARFDEAWAQQEKWKEAGA